MSGRQRVEEQTQCRGLLMDKHILERKVMDQVKNPNIAVAVAAGAAVAFATTFVWKRIKNRKAQS